MKIEITLIEPLLGTLAGNKELVEDYIAGNHPDGVQDDEIKSIPEQVVKGSTYFARTSDDKPHLWDYQIKGFFKDACSMLNRTPKHALKAHKKIVDGLIFPRPRKIPLVLSGDLFFEVRPIRIDGPKGERVALARSEAAPIGTKLRCDILFLDAKLKPYIKKWLDYGVLRGLGQWRNSGMGRFTWAEVK